MPEPKTLVEAVQVFADPDTCHAYMVKLKWPDGRIVCPKCGCDKVGNIASRRMLQCKSKDCRKQFSAKVGTIFEDSPLPLSQWFVAVWCLANFKMGISSCELARTLDITQKSAWFMLHRIRLAMKTATFQRLHGVVESDETYIGGLSANMHAKVRERKIRGRGPFGKSIVHGVLERNSDKKAQDSQVQAQVIPDTEAGTLLPIMRATPAWWSMVSVSFLFGSKPTCAAGVPRRVPRSLTWRWRSRRSGRPRARRPRAKPR